MSLQERGFASLAGVRAPDEVGEMSSGTGAAIAIGLIALPIVSVLGVFAYLIYDANQDPVTPEEENAQLQRAMDATKQSGVFGAVTETLAVAKERKSMKTPFGFRVPNLARFILPEADQTRAISGAYASMKGIPQ